jgi:hypothetical protein
MGVSLRLYMNKKALNTTGKGLTRAFTHIDSRLQNYYFAVVATLALFVAIHFLRVGYYLAGVWNGWIIGDWLLNYENGFIRRGLLGTLFVKANQFFDLPINWIIFWTQGFVFILFLIFFLTLISKRKLTGFYLLLCFSPATLLFTYYDGMAVGRKEILLYFFFATWLIINSNKVPSCKANLLCAIFGFILTLAHELFFFYSIYFYYTYKRPHSNGQVLYWPALLVPLSSLVAIVFLLVWGGAFNKQILCDDFITRGAVESVCEGIISYGSTDFRTAVTDYLENAQIKSIVEWAVLIALLFFPYYCFYRRAQLSTYQYRTLCWQFFLAFGLTVPLFVLTIDWGRWIAIHATLSLMYAATHLTKNERYLAGGRVGNQLKKKAKQNFLLSLLVVIATYLIFNLSYSIRHCCQNNFFVIGGPLIKLKSTIESALFTSK